MVVDCIHVPFTECNTVLMVRLCDFCLMEIPLLLNFIKRSVSHSVSHCSLLAVLSEIVLFVRFFLSFWEHLHHDHWYVVSVLSNWQALFWLLCRKQLSGLCFVPSCNHHQRSHSAGMDIVECGRHWISPFLPPPFYHKKYQVSNLKTILVLVLS